MNFTSAYLFLGLAHALLLRPHSTVPEGASFSRLHAFVVMVLVWPLAWVATMCHLAGRLPRLGATCRAAVGWLGATWA
jgi:hypothetical protein